MRDLVVDRDREPYEQATYDAPASRRRSCGIVPLSTPALLSLDSRLHRRLRRGSGAGRVALVNWQAVAVGVALLSLLVNGVTAFVLYSFKPMLRVAILEALKEVSKEFATKSELQAVEARIDEKIALSRLLKGGFAEIRAALEHRAQSIVSTPPGGRS